MVGHDGESVELVAVLIAVVEQEFQHQVGVCGAGEQGAALMGDEGDGVGLHGVPGRYKYGRFAWASSPCETW